MRALERREPESAAGKRPATPSLLLMVRLVLSEFVEINPVYFLAIHHECRGGYRLDSEFHAQEPRIPRSP